MKKNILVASFLFCSILSAPSQDLFDYDHSLKYARYLFLNNDYEASILELNRCLYLNNETLNDSTIIHMLLKSYRFLKRYDEGTSFINSHFSNRKIPDMLREELHNGYILSHMVDEGLSSLNLAPFEANFTTTKYKTAYLILKNKYHEAQKELNASLPVIKKDREIKTSFQFLLIESANEKYKSPFIAASLSTIVPGLGKVYSKRSKDGLFSFLFTSTSAYQSYRAFNKNGSQSVVGWIYGALAAGLYIGNIYGSSKAAKDQNEYVNEKHHEKAIHILDLEY